MGGIRAKIRARQSFICTLATSAAVTGWRTTRPGGGLAAVGLRIGPAMSDAVGSGFRPFCTRHTELLNFPLSRPVAVQARTWVQERCGAVDKTVRHGPFFTKRTDSYAIALFDGLPMASSNAFTQRGLFAVPIVPLPN